MGLLHHLGDADASGNGDEDGNEGKTQSLQYFTALQTLNIPSRLIVLKYDGHWPSNLKSMPLYYNAHLDWFHRYLGAETIPSFYDGDVS